ncbi:hypothetical protein CSOJ01_05884 [Colletotrichum sojae]|uniref:Heterokaryon incompatibility domain-containing protein n=1 Tax=Colletotrichum sojae TaxID=2175907 RepID=A0A8H6MWU7_9PEZI|nr:hypothetical protein CSOJ01_05884 [Colletotrichum sojae]
MASSSASKSPASVGMIDDTLGPVDDFDEDRRKEENIYLTAEGGRIPPDEVLDRAVEYAAHEGLRCIWIDRSCLPQDKSRIHQVGIQSMDLVYQRAARTAAILEIKITRQATLSYVGMLLAWGETYRTFGEVPDQTWWNIHSRPPGIMIQDELPWGVLDAHVPRKTREQASRDACHEVLDLLETLAKDRWYTRAWILQEYDKSPFVSQKGSLLKSVAGEQQAFVVSYTELRFLIEGVRRMIVASIPELIFPRVGYNHPESRPDPPAYDLPKPEQNSIMS